MKTLKTLVLAAGLLVTAAAGAAAQDSLSVAPSHQAAGERLLRAMHVEQMLTRTMELMFTTMLEQDPEMAQMEDILREFVAEAVDWETMGPLMLQVYVETYSEEELNAMAAFYETPVGQRIVLKMPELTARTSLLSQQAMQERMPELIGKLMERMGETEQKGSTKP
jgi:hypothetical protein